MQRKDGKSKTELLFHIVTTIAERLSDLCREGWIGYVIAIE
jgi:hypothetical protein